MLFFKKNAGLTLIEWLIVIAIISLLLIIIFAHINPLRERDRATDSRRKADLDRISIALDEFYSDYDCYPTKETFELDEGLRPYLSKTPHDPDTGRFYAYYPEESSCPQYYRVYTSLRWQADPSISKVGCQLGCGPDGTYNYGLASPGFGLTIGESATGCSADIYGDGVCWTCVATYSEELGISVCACNQSDECGRSRSASLCFTESTCGGHRLGPMPY
ncbi:MAG: prepilin-type N-terminal cleavage/methylation domain-containing protein [Candidatus Shapirobacteria bacterium]|nr:prepilin-type N-terminal cleavage/methylation domain-containing protein [Candidatus Shapirobacteria bacterium]MDD5481529.1 prepilin-type N-terminal cleavage/methylation domain-containing protein [Candidatus Shapirobacteria bacterium]